MKSLQELQNLIDKHAQIYYRSGGSSQATVSDAIYDSWVEQLRTLSPEDPRLTRVGVPYSDEEIRTKSPHAFPMNSLEKTSGGIEGVSEWMLKLNAKTGKPLGYVLTLKYDGSSCEICYKDGKLTLGATRGNGFVGENITSNVAAWLNVPHTIPYKGFLSIRGEAFLTHENFNTINALENVSDEDITNARNVGNGIIGRKDGQYNEYITFMPFNVRGDKEFHTYSSKFEFLESLGFKVPEITIVHTPAQINQKYLSVLNDRTTLNHDIDGLVLAVDSIAAQEALDADNDDKLHPKYSVAVKFPVYSSQTTVTGCIITAGHNGSLNPTITVKTVKVGGVDVSNVLLNNWSNDSENPSAATVCIGDTIEVGLAGDIIPKVLEVIKAPANHKPIEEPACCPFCGTKTTRVVRGKEGAVTYCGQYDDCPEAKYQKIANWFNKLNILGIGETMQKQLVKEGFIKSPTDIFKLTTEIMAGINTGKTTVGVKRAAKIYKEIQEKRVMQLNTFLGCLGIPLLGRRRAEILIKAANGKLDKLENWLDSNNLRSVLHGMAGVGDAILESLVTGLQKHSSQIADFLANGVVIEEPKAKKSPPVGGVDLSQYSFCITGTRECLEEIEAAGGIIKSGVSRGLNYLIQADPLSASTKSRKAEEYGIKIISIDFMKKVLKGQAKLD